MAASAHAGTAKFAEFACWADDLLFGDAYAIIHARSRLCDREKPMGIYN